MSSNKPLHIDWIDGAKGVAIISVFLLHSMPCLRETGWMLHIGQAVPVFLFLTAYLTSIRYESLENYYTQKRFLNIVRRILVPALVVLAVQILVCQISGHWWSWKSVIKAGGMGPGSYYVWLYLQTWLILPLVIEFVKRVPVWCSFSVSLICAAFCEYAFVPLQHLELAEQVYRLLPVRYLMVLYMVCVWPMLKEKQQLGFYILATISGLLMLVDVYGRGSIQEYFVPSWWEGHHWFTALYVLIPIALMQRIPYSAFLQVAGKYSWQLFLLQMLCFGFLS